MLQSNDSFVCFHLHLGVELAIFYSLVVDASYMFGDRRSSATHVDRMSSIRPFSCDCSPRRAHSTFSSTKADPNPSKHPSFSASASQIAPLHPPTTMPTPPRPSADTDAASASSSHLTIAQTVGVVLASIFSTLVSILICRRCWVEWRMWKRRNARRQGSDRSSRSSRTRSLWEWIGEGGRSSGRDMAEASGTRIGRMLGGGFQHVHVREEKGKGKEKRL